MCVPAVAVADGLRSVEVPVGGVSWVQVYYTDSYVVLLSEIIQKKILGVFRGVIYRDVKVVLNKIDFTERGRVANIINSRGRWRSRLVFGMLVLLLHRDRRQSLKKYWMPMVDLLSKSWMLGDFVVSFRHLAHHTLSLFFSSSIKVLTKVSTVFLFHFLGIPYPVKRSWKVKHIHKRKRSLVC